MSVGVTFEGGVHPLHHIHEGKRYTRGKAVVEMEAPELVRIPMSQHIGAPAHPIVKVGQKVKMGQPVGEAHGFVSTPVHASVSGTVKDITTVPNINGKPVQAVIIENDFQYKEQFYKPCNYEAMEQAEIIERIQEAGIVGMGGATFPTHVKLSIPPGKQVDYLLINGAECEPFLTADHRLLLERTHRVVTGIKIVMRALGVKKAFIGVENNKPDAISRVKQLLDTHAIRLVSMQTKYPQGSEKQLIQAVTGREVPSGGLPMDIGVVVVNVATAAAIADAFLNGEPLIRRIVTVAGAVQQPQNLMVRLGTSIQEVIEYVGGFKGKPLKIISGGPMMGLPVPTTECVITKGSSGILVLDKRFTRKEIRGNCIRCGKCIDSCPIHLYPCSISELAEAEDFEKAEGINAMDCISCGACSYVCPAKIPIAQNIKFAKEMILVNRVKEKQKAQMEAAAREAQGTQGEAAEA